MQRGLPANGRGLCRDRPSISSNSGECHVGATPSVCIPTRSHHADPDHYIDTSAIAAMKRRSDVPRRSARRVRRAWRARIALTDEERAFQQAAPARRLLPGAAQARRVCCGAHQSLAPAAPARHDRSPAICGDPGQPPPARRGRTSTKCARRPAADLLVGADRELVGDAPRDRAYQLAGRWSPTLSEAVHVDATTCRSLTRSRFWPNSHWEADRSPQFRTRHGPVRADGDNLFGTISADCTVIGAGSQRVRRPVGQVLAQKMFAQSVWVHIPGLNIRRLAATCVSVGDQYPLRASLLFLGGHGCRLRAICRAHPAGRRSGVQPAAENHGRADRPRIQLTCSSREDSTSGAPEFRVCRRLADRRRQTLQ